VPPPNEVTKAITATPKISRFFRIPAKAPDAAKAMVPPIVIKENISKVSVFISQN
jgi:hypothetical protein